MSPSPALPLVVLLSGFWPHATAEAARDLSAADPRWNLLLYTSGRPGELIRTDASGVARDDRAGPDLPAALVRDLLTVAGPGRPDLLVLLPESCEPDQLRAAWAAHDGPHHAHLGTLITVVDAGLLLDGLSGEESLRSVGLHQRAADERGIGDVVARQIEQADAVVVTGRPGDDPWEAEQLRVLLRRIAPWSLHLHLDDARLPGVARRPARHLAPLTPPIRGLAGRAVGLHEPLPDHGVVSCVFRARRPFHPARLHHALADLTDQVLRARGHFWLASRPDLVMSWESAGDRTFSPAGVWLDGRPDESWAEADEQRRVAAALDWHVYYGDRHHHLVFIGLDIDPVRIHRVLAACLLTDDELSRGENFWRRLPDPFAPAYAFPA